MAHAQKPDFVFRRNERVHLKRAGASVQWTTGSRGVCISGSNAACTMFRGSVKGTGYPPHSPVSSSLPLPCVKVCHHISTVVYQRLMGQWCCHLQGQQSNKFPYCLPRVSDTEQHPRGPDLQQPRCDNPYLAQHRELFLSDLLSNVMARNTGGRQLITCRRISMQDSFVDEWRQF